MRGARAGLVAVWIALSSLSWAATPWEVAVLFLGAREADDYQGDIDRSIIELARLKPSAVLRLAIHREFKNRWVEFHPDPAAPVSGVWDSLFFKPAVKGVPISGRWVETVNDGDETILQKPTALSRFFAEAFPKPHARRLLVLYGHGEGFEGLRGLSLKHFERALKDGLPARPGKPLDVLWLNSCFMGTAEGATQLAPLADRLMASEDAEFSAGAPFESLQEALGEGPDSVDEVTHELAEAYLTSYSYIAEGSKTHAVYKSSATMGVIDLNRMNGFAERIAALSQSMKRAEPKWRDRLRRRIPNLKMEREDLVDAGALFLALKDLDVLPPENAPSLKEAIRTIEVGRRGKLKTNPRILVKPPQEDSLLVFAYENWTRGHERDTDILEKLPSNLKPRTFVTGPNRKSWPGRMVHKQLYLTPFTVGLNRFDFFFADPETGRARTRRESRTRDSDFVTFEAESDENPIRFSGYTQGVGKTAERYSGLSILNPLGGLPSLDYAELRFYETTRWGDF